MSTKRLAGVVTLCVLGSCPAVAQDRGGKKGPPPQMSFFVTSEGGGKGADLGGLAGGDALCQRLAGASGQPGADSKTWHAYLSTQGPGAVNARDRIGNGPWYNAKGQQIAASLAELHGDTVEFGRLGNRINKVSALDEKGNIHKGVGDTPNEHDVLTGSQPDGRAFTDNADHTCNNWTSSSTGTAMLGHLDRLGGPNASWNSVHPSQGCSQQNLIATGGAGFLYCFAMQ
jgi:hypothetical protein